MAQKITKELAHKIRTGIAMGDMTRKEAAEFHGVCLETINRICRGETHRGRYTSMLEGPRLISQEESDAMLQRLLQVQAEVDAKKAGGAGTPEIETKREIPPPPPMEELDPEG